MNSRPISDFIYVDAAFGGVNMRNSVRKLSAVPPPLIADCYVSHNRATDALVTWVQGHTNGKGNPTVKGFDGETWADNFHADFDFETDPTVAQRWLLDVLDRLEAWGVNLRAVRITFSGNKGFGLEIPHTMFGGFTPSKEFPRRLKRAAKHILRDITYDPSVYDTLRLWRLENSKNSGSGLYKIRLTVAEVRTLTIDQIRALATGPRDTSTVPDLAPIADDEWAPVDELVRIWDETITDADDDDRPSDREQRLPTDTARDQHTVSAIVASWPPDGSNMVEDEAGTGKVSRHHDYLMPIVGFLVRLTSTEHARSLVEAAAEQAGDRTFLRGRDWRSEIGRLADGAEERLKGEDGGKVRGLPSLAQNFPMLATVLEALWPRPTIGFTEDDRFGPTRSEDKAEQAAGDDLSTLSTHTTRPRAGEIPWPEPLEDEAFYGLAGDVVRTIEPHSEADPAAVLAHFLSGASAFVGLESYAIAGDAAHPAKLNCLVVGKSSQGRKGTAGRATERVLRLASIGFEQNIIEGLSSGEGLIWQVRDPIYKWERPKGGGEVVEVLTDPGVADKRLWVIETEFATTLRVMQRDGNTLTAIVRRAWDRDDLRTLTKNTPAQATGAHVAITGHISRDELLRYLDRSELANGFANRFLTFASRRSKLLPDDAGVPQAALQPLADRLARARAWASEGRVLTRDAEAAEIWRQVYEALSVERVGMFGMATSRAPAQVVRLSVLYAILDQSPVIRAEHLAAALAVWRYCEQAARWVFGDATGDPTADTILPALRRNGELDRENIYQLLGRHVQRSRIDAALGLLLTAGLVTMRRQATGGRPREVWRAT